MTVLAHKAAKGDESAALSDMRARSLSRVAFLLLAAFLGMSRLTQNQARVTVDAIKNV